VGHPKEISLLCFFSVLDFSFFAGFYDFYELYSNGIKLIVPFNIYKSLLVLFCSFINKECLLLDFLR